MPDSEQQQQEMRTMTKTNENKMTFAETIGSAFTILGLLALAIWG